MEKLKYVLVTRNRPGQRQAIEWLPVATHRSQLSLLIEFDREDSAEREAEAFATAAQGVRRVFADVERLESRQRQLVLNKLREGVTEVVPVHVLRSGRNSRPGVEVGQEGLCLRVQAGPKISGDRVDDRLG
ncbi:MAG: hypothetical protein EOP84_22550 [Verrucomicrobiaceae bacterium]|nr:MAG: hypothetical protein EOP84_22550 [Verrucomicrobiaceae bacterium]